MTTESKTPRCDSMQSGGYDLAYFARSLERELAAALEAEREWHEDYDRAMLENARLREAQVEPAALVALTRTVELVSILKTLETAARRYANGLDSSATYVLKICDKARATLTPLSGI